MYICIFVRFHVSSLKSLRPLAQDFSELFPMVFAPNPPDLWNMKHIPKIERKRKDDCIHPQKSAKICNIRMQSHLGWGVSPDHPFWIGICHERNQQF